MLITRPNHDITTDYLFFWSQSIIDYMVKAKKSFVDLLKKRANFKEFNSIVKKVNPKLIVFNGHGSQSVVTGYDNEPLVECGKNSDILKDSIVYARSCSSAKKLGVESISKGCRAYIGYDEDFVFMVENDRISKPLQDKTAEIFLKPSNQVAISLLKGNTTGESNKRSKELYRKQILQYMTSDATAAQKELIPPLFWNYNHQVCLGDQFARI